MGHCIPLWECKIFLIKKQIKLVLVTVNLMLVEVNEESCVPLCSVYGPASRNRRLHSTDCCHAGWAVLSDHRRDNTPTSQDPTASLLVPFRTLAYVVWHCLCADGTSYETDVTDVLCVCNWHSCAGKLFYKAFHVSDGEGQTSLLLLLLLLFLLLLLLLLICVQTMLVQNLAQLLMEKSRSDHTKGAAGVLNVTVTPAG